jgi:hypothetical protein
VATVLDSPEVMFLPILPVSRSLGGRAFGFVVGAVLELLLTAGTDDGVFFTCVARKTLGCGCGWYVGWLAAATVVAVGAVVESRCIACERVVVMIHDVIMANDLNVVVDVRVASKDGTSNAVKKSDAVTERVAEAVTKHISIGDPDTADKLKKIGLWVVVF